MTNPTNILGWLTNLKSGLESGLFLQEDFLDPAQLMSTFGAFECPPFRQRGTSQSEFTELSGFDSVHPPYMKEQRPIPALSLRIDKTSQDNVLVETWLRFQFETDSYGKLPVALSFKNVVGLFGENWTDSAKRFPVSSRTFPTPTHPMGNETLIYDWELPDQKSTLTLELSPAGYLFRGEAKSNRNHS